MPPNWRRDRRARAQAGGPLALQVDDGAKEWLAMNGVDPLYRARRLVRPVRDQPALIVGRSVPVNAA